jgi:hypothetical protein
MAILLKLFVFGLVGDRWFCILIVKNGPRRKATSLERLD